MLDSLLAGVILFSSFAMRTPNVLPNPDDYEFSIGAKNHVWYMNRQWERELGNDFVDTQLWVMYDNNGVYFKPEYFDKQSKDVFYLKVDMRSSFKGITFGLTSRNKDETLKTFENFFSGGYKVSKEYGKVKIDFPLTDTIQKILIMKPNSI
ncbi:hypothetical protein H8D04_01220 [bacterium]|nr:hypothetical protein [bacterium]